MFKWLRQKEKIVMPELEELTDSQVREQFPANVENSTEFHDAVEKDETPSATELSNIELYAPEQFNRLINDPEVVGWLSTEEQELLFSALLLFYSPEQTILDVGCGRADLYGYLTKTFNSDFSSLYSGIDLNDNLIQIASNKFDNKVNIETVDLLSTTTDPTHDWVVASGIFNLNDYPNMADYVIQCVDHMYARAKIGVAFNLLTLIPEDLPEADQAALASYLPGEWLEFFIQRYNKVICRADYMLGDVTYFILK